MSIEEIAKKLVASGKGILAADESSRTIAKRFEKAGIEDIEENRRLYRELFFTTEGVEEFISGVIMFDETIWQSTKDGVPFPKLLSDKGIIPGIKVDTGVEPFGEKGETLIKKPDGLDERLAKYSKVGAQFTKFRSVITIGEDIPTDECLRENAKILAQFAVKTQNAGMVPIVEPEVIMDGPHSVERCLEVTEKTLRFVFEELKTAGANLKGLLLKPNMIISGTESTKQSTKEEVAKMTIDCFMKVVPADVAGIVFLSGGQTDERATQNLNEINKVKSCPWPISFSFGRGLQQASLTILHGDVADSAKREEAKKAFYAVAQKCSLAQLGKL